MAHDDSERVQIQKQRIKIEDGVKLGAEIAIGFLIVGFVVFMLLAVVGMSW